MSVENESRIRELFRRLKEEDELSVPSFSETLDGRQRICALAGSWSFRLKLTLALLALIAFLFPVLVHLNQGADEPAEEWAVELLDWESPTDFLLTFSEPTLWTTLPEIPEWVEERYEE